MKLNAPKVLTWWVSLALGVAGLVVFFAGLNSLIAILLLVLGLLLLLFANALKGL